MKKILNEWRNYLNESPNTIASRLDKLTKKLERSRTSRDKYQLAAIRIVMFLSGKGQHLCDYVKKNKDILTNHCDRLLGDGIPEYEELGRYRDEFFTITPASVGTSPTVPKIRINARPFGYVNVLFDDEKEMEFKIQILRNMIEKEDCDFNLFYVNPWAYQYKYGKNKPKKTRGAGYGQAGFTVPPGMSDAETQEYFRNYLKWKEYNNYISNTLRPSDLGYSYMKTKEFRPGQDIDLKKSLSKAKMGYKGYETPKPLTYDAPLPDDFFDKQAAYMEEMPAVYDYLASAWEKSLPRITDKLSRKHAEREARNARQAAKDMVARTRAFKSGISDTAYKMDLYIDRNIHGIKSLTADNNAIQREIDIIEGHIEIEKQKQRPTEYFKKEYGSIQNAEKKIEKMEQEIADNTAKIRRMKEENKEYEAKKPGSMSLESLVQQAKAGDKEAAKQAREIAYKEMTELQKYNDPKDRKRIDDLKKIAREMRRFMR